MKKLILLLLLIPLFSFGQDVKAIIVISGDTFEIENSMIYTIEVSICDKKLSINADS
jgi:hypothetical protein|tara:strand:- start:166 stop:336 length:171 start_codon:yes stop_codon:yes gene_type:complete